MNRDDPLTPTDIENARPGLEVISMVNNIWRKRTDGMWDFLTRPEYSPTPSKHLPQVWLY